MSILVKSDRHLSISSVESLRNINEELREHVLRLRAQLDSEKGTLKAVHRQKVADIKNVRDQEHQKALSTVIQLKQKLKEEKDRELENQKEALSLKFESEKLKLAKQKDAEIMKIRQELEVKGNLLQKFFSQSTYQKETSSQSDNYHLRDELSELRLTKRKLEESLCEASVVEKHHAEDLKKLCDTYEVELTKVRKDVQQEVRHLIEELKAKDKVISHLEKDLGHKSQQAMQLQLENKSMQGKLSPIKMSGPIWNYSSAKETDGTNSSNSTTQMGDQELIEFKILELTTLVRDLEEQNIQLTQEKEKLLKTLKDLEQKNKPLLEKNKRFLDKNMELVTINRNLEEKVMSFSEENQTLKDQMDNSRRKANHLSRKLSQEIAERERLAELVRELTGLRRQLSEQYKTIAALKQACSEKDRRIELIQHRKMKRRLRKSLEKSTGVKETYFGYDDDARSVDSEMSASSLSHENCSDDDLWDEYAREEIERNYQQLMREYLELKKSYALIQSQSENCWDPERENKSRRELESDLFICQCQIEDLKNLLEEKGQETKMLEEKENLRSTNQILLEKIIELEKIKESLKEELHEAREQIEDLEFRILEMEEYQNKDRNNEIEELQAELSAASEEEQHPEERQEKLTLLKAHAFLDIIDKSLNDNQKINDASGRARQAVKASDERIESPTKTAAQNETKDLREPGETRMSSPKTNLRTQLMMSQQMEAKYEEVDSHRGQLQELAKGHGKGGADIAENMAQSRPAEQQIHDLEKIAYELQEKTIALQQDKAVLEEKLAATMQQLASNEIDGQCTSKEKKVSHMRAGDELITGGSKLQQELEEYRTENTELKSKVAMLEKSVYAQSKDATNCEVTDNNSIDECNSEFTDNIASIDTVDVDDAGLHSKQLDSIREILSEKGILSHVETMLGEMQLLKEENALLHENLMGKENGKASCTDEVAKQLQEAEDLCEHLRNKVYYAELSERQLKDKLKLAEDTINDLESSENTLRENLDEVIRRESDSKRQTQELYDTMLELKEVLYEKESIEDDLRDKVQSLESAASTSAKKLAELKENEILLRQSLDAQDSSNADAELVGQMKKKVSSLEKSNKQLRGKIAELEESEQILRTNWKQIADEDANKIECLEEKIRMIETVNQELRAKIEEQEENYATTNSISLASELLLNVSDKNDEVDLSQQVKNLEQQLQKVTEEKNCKIEILQEKLEKHRENEMKLSETIAEMEQVEQQMQAKLVLYEHSEVTVEKMLSYEDRISELTSSQENLLEEVGSMANREEDLENELVHTESKYLEIINSLKEQLQQYQQNEKQNSKAISQINPLTNENSVLKSKITDLELKQQHLNSKLEELKKENEKLKHLGKKVELLQDAESKLMERIMELEMGEPKVEYEPLVKVESGPSLQVLQKKFDFQLNDKTPYASSSEPSKTASVPARNVSSLFGRVQELEAENQQLTSRVSELEAADLLSKKYEEKIRILEHSEGKLMDRIVELEESEQALKNNLKKQEKSSRGVFGVSEISTVRDEKKTLQLTLKHTEEEMDKIKVKFQKAQNLLKEEKEKVENLMRLEEELRRNVEEETMLNNQLTDQLRSFKERLDQVKITYDQKIDALLNSEKQLKDEINCHIQQKAALKEKLEAVQKKNCLILEKIQKFQQGKLSQTHLFSTLEDVEFQDNHHVLPRDEHASTVETKNLHSNSVVSVHPLHSFTNQEKYTVCAKCQTGSFSDLQQDYLLQISKLENSLDDLRDTSNDHSKSENFQVPLTKSNLLTHSHNDFLAMSKSDLIQMVRTLEQQQNNKQKRVKELEENLVAFRKAVEGRTTIVREEEIVKIVEKKVETFHKSKSQAFRTRPVKSSNDLDELLQQLESMKEFETELQLSLKQAQETLQQEKRKHEDDLKQLQQEIKDLEQQKGEAEQKIKELEEALANLQVQLNEKNYGLVDTTLLKSQQQEGDKLKQLKKNEVSLKNQVKELQERETELQSRLSILEKTEIVLKDKVSNLQKSSSRLKSRIKELENSGLQQQASQITQQKLQRKGNKTVEESPQQHLHISQDPKMIQVPQGDYKKWQAKVALLEEMEGQVNKTKKLNAHLEETSQLLKRGKDTCCHKVQVEIQRSQLQSYTKVFQILKDLLLTDLQKSELTGEGVPNVEEVLRVLFSKEASQRQEAEPTVTSSLTLQRAQYLGALPEEKPRTLDKGLQTDMSSNNLRPDWVERIAAEDIIVQGPSKLRPLETASPEKKRELIVNLASCLPITDIPVGSQSKSSTKDSVVEAEKILPALSGARSHQPKHKHKSKMHGSHIRQEEIEVGLWLSSEEDELQNDTDSSSSSTRVNLNGDVLDAPPLPSTQPPPLQKNTVENFVGDMSKTRKSQHHLIAKVPSEPHSSKLKVVKLEKELESKNSYITSMETAIDKLWKMLKEQGACCTEEALKELQKQLSQMQSELQDQHAEGQHSISSLRKELLNREHSLVAKTIPKSKYKHSGASLYPLSSTDQLTIMSTSDEDKDIPASPQNCTGRMFSKADMNLEQHLDEKSEETGHGSFNHLPTSNSVVGEHAETKCFVAAADYNPELFSASGHLVLELPLKEGDVVKVKGPLGRSGYYEAEVNGKMGLVPAKYLHPLHNTEYGIKERRLRRLQLVPDHLDSSPEQILQLHSQLIEDHHSGYIASLPNIPSSVNRRNKPANLPHHDVSSPTSAKPQTASQNSAKGSPEAPSNFHIERLVGDSSVLLSWKTPVMDEFDRNNGSQLIGYRIFINGRLCQQPGSAHLAKAVIENIDLAHPQYFAIQSVAANGQMSRPAEVIFEGVEEEHMESEEESDTDLTAVLPKTHFEDGQQRLFIAVYDYNPYHHSPHDYTGYELAFHAGDTITVYGNQRPDGFYRGEISGQRGLVPGSFIEEVLMGTRSKMVSSHGSMTSQNSLVQMSGRSLTEKRSVRP